METDSALPQVAPGEMLDMSDDLDALQRLHTMFQAQLGQITPIAAETSQWLLASLLAVNGGALLAFLSSDRLSTVALTISGPAWLAGVMLALGVGVLNVIANQKAIALFGDYIAGIEGALISHSWKVPDWQNDHSRMLGLRKWPWIVGSLSGICFAVGSVAAAVSLISTEPNPTPTPTAPDTHTKAAAQDDHSQPAVGSPSRR
jgi:hypothetical protein